MQRRQAEELTKPITDLLDQLTGGLPVTGRMAVEAETAVEKILTALTEMPDVR